jgi:hypothetical protein
MSSDAIPGVFSLVLTEDELAEFCSDPTEYKSSSGAALFVLNQFSVSLLPRELA